MLPKLIRAGYLLLTPRYMYYSPYADMLRGGVSRSELVYSDERILEQIDWSLEVSLLPLAPATLPIAAPTVRRPQHVMLDLMAVTRALAEMKQLSLTKTGSLRVADLRNFQKRLGWEDAQAFDGYPFPSIASVMLAAWHKNGWLQITDDALIVTITPETAAQQPLRRQVLRLVNGIISNEEWCEMPNVPTYQLEDIPAGTLFTFPLPARHPGQRAVLRIARIHGGALRPGRRNTGHTTGLSKSTTQI